MQGTKFQIIPLQNILLSAIQTHPSSIYLYGGFVLCKYIVHQFYFIISLQPVLIVYLQMLV